MDYDKPVPQMDGLNQPFWDMARAGKLGIHVCGICGKAHYPGTPVCSDCLSSKLAWQSSSGRGTLLSWAKFHRAYWSGFERDLPFTIGLVRIEEGPLLAFTLVEFNEERLRIDLPVEAVFDPVTNELTLPRFRPLRV